MADPILGRPGEDPAPTEPRQLVAAVEAGAWPEVLAFVRANIVTLIVDQVVALRWALRLVPDEVLEEDLVIKSVRDLSRFIGVGVAPGEPLPDDPEELLALGRSTEAEGMIAVGTAQSCLLRVSCLFEAAASVVKKVSIVAAEARRAQPDAVAEVLPLCQAIWGYPDQLLGDFDRALAHFEAAYAANLAAAQPALARMGAGGASLSAAVRGDVELARLWLSREEDLPLIGGPAARRTGVAGNVARALVALDTLERDVAAEALGRLAVLDFGEEYWAFVAYAFAQYGLVYDPPGEAYDQLVDASAGKKLGDGIAEPMLESASVDLMLASGQGERARRVLAHTDARWPSLRVSAARLELLAGRYPEAELASTQLAAGSVNFRAELEALLVRSVAQHKQGRTGPATETMAAALRLGGRYQLLRSFATVARADLETIVALTPVETTVLADLDRLGVRDLYPSGLQLTELTQRERLVLEAFAAGLSVEEVAEKQFVSVATIKSQRHSVYAKLGVHSRQDAVKRASELGLL